MKCFKKEQPVKRFFIFYVERASRHDKISPTSSSFNPFPPLPSVATNSRKQNQRHNIVFNNKPRKLFVEFSGGQDIVGS